MAAVDLFIEECRNQQPDLAANYLRFFNGVIALPIENELLLQAYIANNFRDIFKVDGEPVLYEHPLPKDGSHSGKPDFIYVTEEKVLLAETKFVDLKESGKTARSRRTQHRKKVSDQVMKSRNFIIERWGVSPNEIKCSVFSNDELTTKRAKAEGIDAHEISTASLIEWREMKYRKRFG